MPQPWITYILKCKHGILYTGITNDIENRIIVHNQGKGGSFTNRNKPCALIWHEHHKNRSSAQKRECEIKSWKREKKLRLVKSNLL